MPSVARIFHSRAPDAQATRVSLSILHAIAPGPVGGAESALLTLVCGLREQGHDASVVALADQSSAPFIERLTLAGVPVEIVDSPGRNYLADVRGIRRALGTRRANVVHTHGYRADIVGLFASLGGVPSVATAHGFTGGGWKNRLNQHLQVAALRHHDAVIAVSAPLAEQLARKGVRQDRMFVLRNAWRPGSDGHADRASARAALGLPVERPVVGWLGRLAWVKAPEAALEAFVAAGVPGATLSFVGEGPDRSALEAAARRLGVAERVRFHGLVPDAWRVLPAFDALLLSSRSEGTPMVLLEAMHAGVPIVSTAVGGVPDLLDQRSARLVPWGDTGRLGAAIAEVLKDREAATIRAAAARVRLDTDFAPGAWVARHVDLYRRLTGHA